MSHPYRCSMCGLLILREDPHTDDRTGEDVHEACCPQCHPELYPEDAAIAPEPPSWGCGDVPD